jgi:hypothetical protein
LEAAKTKAGKPLLFQTPEASTFDRELLVLLVPEKDKFPLKQIQSNNER